MTKNTSTSTKRRTAIGAVKEELTKLVARYDGDARGEALAKALRKLGYDVDTELGLRAVHFIERHCRHTEGDSRGRLFLLASWQFVIVFSFFGCVRANGKRLFRRLWLEVAKKNGKTELIGAIMLYCLVGLKNYGSTVYSAAAAAKQANETYKVMASMIGQDKVLRRMVKRYSSRHYLHCPEYETSYEVISADADYNDGLRAPACGVDEVHRHKNRGIWDVLKNGQGVFSEPIFIAITTAAAGREGLAWEEHERARQVIEGTLEDDALLAFIYAVPEEANWLDESNWFLANPALGDFLRLDDVRQAIADAQASPSEENSVRRLRLNQWVAAETKWLDLLAWEKCGATLLSSLREECEGRPFYGGFDISHSADFTAWSRVFPWIDGTDELGIDVLVDLWLPEDAVAKLRQHMRPTVEAWIRDGFIHLCPGEVVDLRMVRDKILADCEANECLGIGYDKFHAHGIVSDLMEEMDDMLVDVGQTFSGMNAPCKELERLLARRRIRHGGHPVLRWMAGNAVAERNQDDLIRPSRKKSAEKIDGLVSTLMALERAMHEEEQPGFYMFVAGEGEESTG